MVTERCPLAEYAPGDRFEGLLVAIRTVRSGTDRNGKLYAEVKIADWSGSRSAKFWKVTEAEVAALARAEFLEITGQVDNSERFAGDFTVNRYSVAPAPDDLSPFLEIPPPSNREYRERFVRLVKSVQDRELRIVLREVFGDEDGRRRFFRAYAAAAVHHAFPGGLLEHTVEVAELCSGACATVVGLDRDLLVTGALLHDIGKMEEMNQDLRAGEYTDDGCLIGHIVIGSNRVASAIDKHNLSCAPEDLVSEGSKRAIIHLILAHHGLPEHGAARKPAFAEAAVLYLCDNISAKTRQHLDLVSQNTVGATSVFNRFLDTQVYVKPVRRTGAAGGAAIPLTEISTESDEAANTTFVTAKTLPVLGRVAAGNPDEASQERPSERRRVVPPPGGADYLLRVVGESMIEANIHSGDLLFVRRQTTGSEGEIVVAHIPGEGQTVKRLRLNPAHECGFDGPYLEAANPDPRYRPIALGGDAQIQGKVTGLLRDL